MQKPTRRTPYPALLAPLAGGALLLAWQNDALSQEFPPGACVMVPNSQTCVDTTPCKTDASSGKQICLSSASPLPPGAFTVSETCWQWTYQFACGSAAPEDSCTAYENNSACSLVTSSCQDTAIPSGVCDSWNYTYQCQTAPATITQQMVCTNGLFNSSGFAALPQENAHMPQAGLAEEILREGQTYSNAGSDLFAGISETCRKGYAGLQNCCSTSPSAKPNSTVSEIAFGAAAQTVKYAGEEAIDWASPYVFDAMYNNGIWTEGMTSVFATGEDTFGTTLSTSGFSLGAFGFSWSSTDVAGQGLMNANTTINAFDGGDGGFLEFNPYVLAATVAIMAVENLISCNNSEQLLAQHKGANLSVYEDTSCSQSFLGICLQHKDRYCSYNSVLAKIIQQQGKVQLGLDPSDCTGLTLQQVSSLDFTRIDFSQFTQSMVANAVNTAPTSASISQGYASAVQNSNGGSAQTRSMTTTSSPVGTSTSPPLPLNPVLPQYPPHP